MSLREQWYAARQQRQQEVCERQQQVLKDRQQIQAEMAALHQHQRATLSQFYYNLATETAEFLSTATANRAAMAAAQREWLSNFHTTLQANVAAFLHETRIHQQEVWLDQAQERAAYVAAMQDYVWGTTPTAGAGGSSNLERIFQYLQYNSGARLSQLETALGLSQVETANALQTLITQGWVVQQDRGYFAIQGS